MVVWSGNHFSDLKIKGTMKLKQLENSNKYRRQKNNLIEGHIPEVDNLSNGTGSGYQDMRRCKNLSGMKNEQNLQTKAAYVPEKK